MKQVFIDLREYSLEFCLMEVYNNTNIERGGFSKTFGISLFKRQEFGGKNKQAETGLQNQGRSLGGT